MSLWFINHSLAQPTRLLYLVCWVPKNWWRCIFTPAHTVRSRCYQPSVDGRPGIEWYMLLVKPFDCANDWSGVYGRAEWTIPDESMYGTANVGFRFFLTIRKLMHEPSCYCHVLVMRQTDYVGWCDPTKIESISFMLMMTELVSVARQLYPKCDNNKIVVNRYLFDIDVCLLHNDSAILGRRSNRSHKNSFTSSGNAILFAARLHPQSGWMHTQATDCHVDSMTLC